MEKRLVFERFVTKQEEGTYFPVEFYVPKNLEALRISYEYERFHETETENGRFKEERNIVDLAVCAAGDRYIGSSGSDRSTIKISAYGSSQGFASSEIFPGMWKIIIGAYKISPDGCRVVYTVDFFEKRPGIYKGDTHMHTTGSDGNLNAEELGRLAQKEGLDYIIITDHNNYADNYRLCAGERLTLIPGAEWTHYRGHAGMLGAVSPFDNPFCVNSAEEMRQKLFEAGQRGALIVLNHPFCPNCGWRFGLDSVKYDLIEVWNGATPADVNRKCLDWWNERLKEGKRIHVTGGSDFHRPEYGRMPGVPCTCLYAPSRTQSDLLEALKSGHSFITFCPDGPLVSAKADGFLPGDKIPEGTEAVFRFEKLKAGDRVVLITDSEEESFYIERDMTEFVCGKTVRGKYLRAEVYRQIPSLGEMPALLTNPFYVEKQRS